jgi:hypothetical protein
VRVLAPGEPGAWRRLVAPLQYLIIRHGIKGRFDWAWPGVLTAITMLVFWYLPEKAEVLGDKGFLKGIRDFIALLAAFFVVALAAVSTFSNDTLDQPMEGTTPRLRDRDLSRRQYVCFLFGYLSVLSFGLFIICIGAEILAPSLRKSFNPTLLWYIRAVLGTMFTFGFWNMVITTLLGIYFLVERVHLRPSRAGTPTEPQGNRRPQAVDRDAA